MFTRFIYTLPQSIQQEIYLALLLAGIEGEDLELAMSSRVCDLEDTIDVRDWR